MTADDTVAAKIAEWEALANAATEGPWTFEPAGESHCAEPQCCSEYWDNRIWGNGVVLAESHMLTDEDAAFIAAARHMVPALLGYVREVRAMHVSSQDARGVGQIRDGAWTPYCEEDFEDWPCPTERVAQKWLGGEG